MHCCKRQSRRQSKKGIDDFNKSQEAGSEAAPVLERLQGVMEEVGIEKELHNQKSLTVTKENLLTKCRRKHNRCKSWRKSWERNSKSP
jgi:hypothetical protein